MLEIVVQIRTVEHLHQRSGSTWARQSAIHHAELVPPPPPPPPLRHLRRDRAAPSYAKSGWRLANRAVSTRGRRAHMAKSWADVAEFWADVGRVVVVPSQPVGVVQGGAGDWRTSGADIPTRTAARVRKGTQRMMDVVCEVAPPMPALPPRDGGATLAAHEPAAPAARRPSGAAGGLVPFKARLPMADAPRAVPAADPAPAAARAPVEPQYGRRAVGRTAAIDALGSPIGSPMLSPKKTLTPSAKTPRKSLSTISFPPTE